MLSFLKNHPFAVETFFETSLVLTYAVAKDELIKLTPECLSLDTFDDKWAFIAVAMVKTKDLRPKGFPRFMGNNFYLTGYRIFVKYTTNEGKRLRGLYIIKSETDKKKMSLFGNLFTHYNYGTTDIVFRKEAGNLTVQSIKSELDIAVNMDNEQASLPPRSPFRDWKEARRFAGPLPFTFTCNHKTKEVLIIEGVREDWIPKGVEVIRSHAGFIDQFHFRSIVLANAFIISDIPYYWKKGKTEIWK